jgi:NAD-dependent dihydropyrimidine dehydrogenase PreA subunit
MRYALITAMCRVLRHPTQRERHRDGRLVDTCPCRRVEDIHWEVTMHQGTFTVNPDAQHLAALGDQINANMSQRLEDALIRMNKRGRSRP